MLVEYARAACSPMGKVQWVCDARSRTDASICNASTFPATILLFITSSSLSDANPTLSLELSFYPSSVVAVVCHVCFLASPGRVALDWQARESRGHRLCISCALARDGRKQTAARRRQQTSCSPKAQAHLVRLFSCCMMPSCRVEHLSTRWNVLPCTGRLRPPTGPHQLRIALR